MNKQMIQRLRDCIEEALKTNLFMEMIVPRLKRAWPESGSRRKLLQQIRAFAVKNGWQAEIFDYSFRVRFVRGDHSAVPMPNKTNEQSRTARLDYIGWIAIE